MLSIYSTYGRILSSPSHDEAIHRRTRLTWLMGSATTPAPFFLSCSPKVQMIALRYSIIALPFGLRPAHRPSLACASMKTAWQHLNNKGQGARG